VWGRPGKWSPPSPGEVNGGTFGLRAIPDLEANNAVKQAVRCQTRTFPAHRGFLIAVFLGLLSCSVAAWFVHAADPVRRSSAPVVSVREFELKPGIKADDFEAFARRGISEAETRGNLGPQMHVLRGERGERKGKYVLVWEFDSIAARDQCFPKEGAGSSVGFRETWSRIRVMLGKFGSYVRVKGDYTDYVLVSD